MLLGTSFLKINAKIFQRKHHRGQSSVLAVVPSSLAKTPELLRRELVRSAIFRTSSMVPSHVTAKPVAPLADFESIKEWMTFCGDHHGNGCPKSRPKDVEPAAVQVTGFRLIGCQTLLVV